MAVIFDPNKDKDQQQQGQAGAGPQQQQGAPGGAATQPVSVSNSQSANIDASAGSNQPASPQGTSSGRFTNIQNYINANKPQQGQQSLAGKIGEKIGGVQQKNTQQFQQSAQNFQQQAGQNRVQMNQGLLDKAVSDPMGFLKGNAQASAPGAPQAAGAAAPGAGAQGGQQPNAELDQFTKMRQGQYKGPEGLQDFGRLKQDTENFQNLTDQTMTEQGRFGMLRNFFSKPTYTRGQQGLDNLLLQGDKSQLNALQQNRTKAAELGRDLKNTQRDATGLAQQYKQEAADTRNKTLGALTGKVSDMDKTLEQKAAEANAKAQKDYETAMGDASLGKMSTEDMLRFGLGADQDLWNVNASEFMKRTNAQANRQNVASAEDYDRFSGYGQLLGEDNNEAMSNIINQYGDKSQAGAFDKEAKYDFDKDAFQRAVNEAKSAYESQIADPNARIAEAESALKGNLYASGGLEAAVDAQGKAIRDQLAQQNPMFNLMHMMPMEAGGIKGTQQAWEAAGMGDKFKDFQTRMKGGAGWNQEWNDQYQAANKEMLGKLSNEQLMRFYDADNTGNTDGLSMFGGGGRNRGNYNTYQGHEGTMLKQLDFERNKMKQNQDRFNQIRQAMGYGKKLGNKKGEEGLVQSIQQANALSAAMNPPSEGPQTVAKDGMVMTTTGAGRPRFNGLF